MSRLLFAAARGARVEYDWYGEWMETPSVPLEEYGRAHRIHPDDEHLQYGPISSALRNFAMYGESRTFEDHMAAAALNQVYHGCSFVAADPVLLGTLALILSEALADEGL